MLKKINDNVSVIDLLKSMGISWTFNVTGLLPYFDSQKPLYPEFSSLRSSFSQVWQIDAEAISMMFMKNADREKPKFYKPKRKPKKKGAEPTPNP